jgi:hypothetical protein
MREIHIKRRDREKEIEVDKRGAESRVVVLPVW